MDDEPTRTRVLASVRRALQGETFPALRDVTAVWGPTFVTLRAYVDGPLSDDDAEALSRVHTEVIADYPPEITVTVETLRGPIEGKALEVYARRS